MNKTPPSTLLPWLTHQTSLTQKLETQAGVARLEVLNQQWAVADEWDQQVLQIKDELVIHREILMWAHDAICWYARTVIPKLTYEHDISLFERLQRESLGQLIFESGKIQRLSLKPYAIMPQSLEYAWLSDIMHTNAPVLWARLSTLCIGERFNFFLVEILLPGLRAC